MTVPSGQTWLSRNPKTAITLIVVILTVAVDFTLTGVYHLLKYGSIHKHAATSTLGERSPVFHHTLKPNVHFEYERWGHTTHSVSTNSLGFRDKAVREVPLSSDKYRVLFMGDSFTQGVGVEYEKTFVGLIEEALAGDRIDVLNGAAVSYSPAIYFKKTEHLLSTVGLRVDQVVVFLDISDIQDEARYYDIQDGRVVWIGPSDPVVRDFLLSYAGLLGNLVRLGTKLYDSVLGDHDSHRTKEEKDDGTNLYRALWTIDQVAYSDYGEIGLRKAQAGMQRLYDLLQSHGVALTLVVYPYPDQILRVDLDSVQVRLWRTWARNHAVPFINLFPDFIQKGQEPGSLIRRYFIPGDVHWNEEGHRLVATRFLSAWAAPDLSSPRQKASPPNRSHQSP